MTEVEVYRPRAEVAVPAVHDTDSWVQVVSDVIKMSNVIYDTPFVPDGLRGSAPAVAAAILAGREMGIGPMTSLQHIHVIKGKPAQSALLMRALIQSAGHKWEDGDVTDTRAVVRGCRRGESSWTEVAFTADQAKRAGIDLGKYPADKLYARATSRLARRKFADVIAGMPYTPEDLEDGDGDTEDGELTAGPAAIEQPRPRTAQRRQRTQSPPSAQAAAAPVPAAVPVQTAGAGGDLPLLPGEDEPPPDPSGPITDDQLTAIWAKLSTVYYFGKDEKDAARGVCAQILKRELASSKDMSKAEASTVLDTLAHWHKQADVLGEEPRGYLLVMLEELKDGEVPSGE
ncbi:MAG TPA: hypothetical protein VL551_16945 [Actinospica sp.]|jgi:hypothetical protein|nr:hypothetical protein [Actinospica sp.]